MALIQLTHDPILNSAAQVFILPTNSSGVLLDPVLMRCKTLYSDHYQHYRRACRDGSAKVGSCLLYKRSLEQVGLAASPNGNQPLYIANLIVSDHPYHPPHQLWLQNAVTDLHHQLIELIRYQGIRRMALLTRPLIFKNESNQSEQIDAISDTADNTQIRVPLDWQSVTLPFLQTQLQTLPNVTIHLHVPKSIVI